MQRIPFDRVARLILSVFAGIFTTLSALPALATDPAIEKQAQALQKKAGGGPQQPTGDFAHVPVPAPLVRTPQKASTASTAQFVTAGAIGLAAVGTGVYFVVESNLWGDAAASLRRDLGAANACTHQPSPKCQQLDQTAHAQRDAMTVAMTLFVGGGLLAAGAALAKLFLWPWEGARPAQTSAWIAPTEGGLTLQVARRLP